MKIQTLRRSLLAATLALLLARGAEAAIPVATGSYVGNGVDGRNVNGLGFTPQVVMIRGEGAGPLVVRTTTIGGDKSKVPAEGDLWPKMIIAMGADGFTLGDDPAVNGLLTTYHWTALGAAAQQLAVGIYDGTGVAGKQVDVGFQPDYVLVFGEDATCQSAQRFADQTGAGSLSFVGAGEHPDDITGFTGTGFSLGTGIDANNPGWHYHYVAVSGTGGSVVTSSYTGDGSLARDVDAKGLPLQALLLARREAGSAPLFRSTTVPAPMSLPATADLPLLTGVTAFTPTGFQVGLDAAANAAGSTYYWVGFRDPATAVLGTADIGVTGAVADATPTEGETAEFTIRVDNLGPGPASGLTIDCPLPAGLAYASSVSTHGTYSPATGEWNVDTLAAGSIAYLTLRATAPPGTAGSTQTVIARVTGSDTPDPTTLNDVDSLSVVVWRPEVRLASGSYVGNGAPSRAITGTAFQPDFVLVKSTTAIGSVARTRTMTGDAAKDLFGATALGANRIRSLDPGGFTVGSDPSVNQAGVTYYWTAILEAPGQVLTGSYTGNGADDRDLAGLGFQPEYVLVLSAGPRTPHHRFADQVGDASLPFSPGAELADHIQALAADGFQVGASADVNAAGVVHHYVAMNAVTGVIAGSSFNGNSSDNRDIIAPGFRPEFVLLQRPGWSPVERPQAVAGDLTLPFVASAAFANGIQSFLPNGFQVGSSAWVNGSGIRSYFMALRSSATDLSLAAAVDDARPDAGQTIQLTLRLINHGPLDADGIEVEDVLPAGVTFQGAAASQGSYAEGTGRWSAGSLAAGDTATLALTALVGAGNAGSTIVNRAAIVTSSVSDAVPANDSASVSFRVPLADLRVLATVDDATPTEGEDVTFSVTVTNLGPDTSAALQVRAELPPELSFLSAGTSQGAYDAITRTWTAGAIAAGGSASLALRVEPAPGTAGAGAWIAARILAAVTFDPAAANDADSAQVRVQRGEFRVVSGSYIGNGAAGRSIAGVGFQPDLLVIRGATASPTIAATKTMVGGGSKELGAAAAIATGRVPSLDADGFTLGANAAVNAPGVAYYWTAFLEAPGQMKVSSYIGNGADDRDIGGLGFAPAYVMVLGSGAQEPRQRFLSESGDASLPFTAGNEQSDRIQGFLADGFQVGARAEVNAPGTVFHFVAWSASSPRVGVAAYTGTGADDRAMSVGFRPEYLLVKREDSEAAVQRPGAVEGDLTLPATTAAPFANGIQTLSPDGFQLGTDKTVNQDGRVHHWAGFRDVATIGAGVRAAALDTVVQAGGTGRFRVVAFNQGPRGATSLEFSVDLGPGLAHRAHTAGAGTFDPVTGAWRIPALAAADSAVLTVEAGVDPGVCGRSLTLTATFAGAAETDAGIEDDVATAALRVPCADVSVTVTADFPTRNEGDPLTILVRARNDGPDPATNVVVSNSLPAGLTWTGATPEQGTFSLATGIWFAGTLAAGDSTRLVLGATVDGGTGGSTLLHIATIDAVENDTTVADRADTAAIYVATGAGIDLLATHPASRAAPGETDVPVIEITLLNSATESRTLGRIELTNRTRGPASQAQLDAELGAVRMTADAGGAPLGTFTPVASVPGMVVFDDLALTIGPGSFVRLRVATDVPLGAADGDSLDLAVDDPSRLVFDLPVNFSAPWPVDPPGAVAVDGMVAAQLAVTAVAGDAIEIGAARVLVFGVKLPPNGYQADVLTGLRVAHAGTAQPGADLPLVELWSDGGDGAFTGAGDDTLLGAAAWDGSAWAATGLAVAIPPAGRRVFVSADVAEGATIGRTITPSVPVNGVTMASGNDGPVDAAVAGAQTLSLRGHDTRVALWAAPQAQAALLPGRDTYEMFRLHLVNQEAAPETLQALTLTNTTAGPGDATQLDAAWLPLRLLRGTTELAAATFAGGRAAFTGLAVALAQDDTVALRVVSGASLLARDGDLLDLALAGAADAAFTRPVNAVATGALDPGGAFAVDGMSLAQVDADGPTAASALIGSSRNLVLDLRVPANGYEPDTLRFLMLRNAGTAAAITDVPRMEAWADDGDGAFEPAAGDPLIGSLIYTNGTWILIGFDLPVPAAGQRVFVTADVSAGAVEGRTIHMLVTSSPVRGLNMASDNDGPVDGEAMAPVAAVISAQDRILVSTDNPGDGTAGAADSIGLMRIAVRSTYTDSSRTLTALTITNATHGAAGGTQADRDAEIQLLHLHDGGPAGPHLATAFFTGGRAVFSGFAWSVGPGEQRELFVDADVSTRIADGDVIEIEVANETGLSFWVPVSMAAAFPLASARWTIDGMRANQIDVPGARPAALGPDDGPVLALDFVVPRNGYRDDVLEGVRLENAGSADPAQIREVRLWSDGGNGVWDAGGDDTDLGAMTWIGSRWVSSALSEAIGAAGLRLFATVATSAAITDSAGVRLRVPVNGLTVQSGNDGPLDRPVTNPAEILLSTSHLLATYDLDAPATVLGDTVFARLAVRNTGAVPILGVAPAAALVGGDGTVSPLGGPQPASLDLAAGEAGMFTWMFLAQATGAVTFSSSAQGAEQGTGTVVRSLKVTTAAAELLAPVSEVQLYATESLPFSISLGQVQVVPLTLTLSNPGGAGGSDALVHRVTIRVEDEFGGAVVPAELLRSVTISEGANVYAEVVSPPLAGSTVDLAFARPVRIAAGGGGQVTLSLSLDIADTTNVSSFRILVDGPASFAAEDATSAAAVPVNLAPPLAYPIRSGLARISAGGTELRIAGAADLPRAVGRGQAGVELAHLTLMNPGPVVYGPDVRLSVMAVSLVDSAGAVVPRPADYLDRIRVAAPPLALLDRAVTAAEGGVMMLAIAPSLSLPINTPVAMTISGDLAAAGPLGAFHLRLADTSLFVARNATTGADLPVITTPDTVAGVPLTVKAGADSLFARSTPALPETLAVGTANVTAMTLSLRHPGDAATGAIRVDQLVLRCRDPFNAPLPPATYLDAVRVRLGGAEAGSVGSLPSSGSEFAIPLAGVTIGPGAVVDLEIVLDIEITAPTEAFAVTFGDDGAVAYDANLGTPVAVAPDRGVDFPLTSGVTRLETPPRELAAAFADAMPAALAADGTEHPAGRLTLRNTAASGEIRLDHLAVMAGDAGYAALALGGLATRVRAYVADTLWAETPDLTAADATGTLAAATPLAVRAGEPVAVDLRFVPAASAGETGFRLGLASAGIGVVQPGGTLFTVAIVAEPGMTFPFWTQVGSLSGTTLPSSYSNFPNPFAAGRAVSRFVYYLRTPGRVTLKLWTARGEPVCTLLDGVAQPAGLRQDAAWDGRNGAGAVVVSGAYVAEIVVAYDDGTTERALRKVAVVR